MLNIPARNKHIDGKKKCPTCGEWKPANNEHFTIKNDRWDKLNPQCKSCQKIYAIKNKGSIQRRGRERYIQKKEHITALNLEWQKNNRERVYEINNKSRRTENGRKTRCRLQQKRDALKNSLICDFTSEQWQATMEHFESKCAYCGKAKRLTQDHFIPLKKGGGYTVSNIIPACLNCNSKKNSFDFSEWYPRQPFYSAEREYRILKFIQTALAF